MKKRCIACSLLQRDNEISMHGQGRWSNFCVCITCHANAASNRTTHGAARQGAAGYVYVIKKCEQCNKEIGGIAHEICDRCYFDLQSFHEKGFDDAIAAAP